ncbi:S49 family peptidase [Leptospira idonii]|nr:S49 family peptidase [Leptospira idonii]
MTRLDFLLVLRSLGKIKQLKTLKIFLPPMDWSLSEFWEVKEELIKLKEQGIRIESYAQEGGLGTLLLMSASNERSADKEAEFHIQLPSAESSFYGGLLKHLGVEVEAYASGPYKSFAETFTRTGFSKEAKKNIEDLILDLQNIILDALTEKGKFKKETFYKPILTAESLKEAGFLDSIRSEKEFFPEEEKALSPNHSYLIQRIEDFKFVSKRKKNIAILPLEGGISSGEYSGKEREAGKIEAYPTISLLKELKEDKNVHVVVLEINSPGGSAFHSELIHREISELKKEKPVFVYFKDTAASGGYYIASAAETITSSPVCITGSIGAVMVRANLKKLYNKAKVQKETVGFYPFREILSEYTPLKKESVGFLQKEIARIESQFYARVSEGRKIPLDQLKTKWGGGRVYLPKTENKIVDSLGGILDVLQTIKNNFPKDKFMISYELPEYNFRSEIPFLKGFGLKQMMKTFLPKEILFLKEMSERPLYYSNIKINWNNRKN